MSSGWLGRGGGDSPAPLFCEKLDFVGPIQLYSNMQTNQIVRLKLPLLTLTNSFQKGDKFKVLGYHGTLLRLSQVNSRKKLMTTEENVEVVNK